VRRVITEVTPDGTSVVHASGEPGTVKRFGAGFELHELWRVDHAPQTPMDGYDPDAYVFEQEGGAVFRAVVIPPDEVVMPTLRDPGASRSSSPYTTAVEEEFGMHATPTLDFITVVSGEVHLRLDDGVEERLIPGDVVVQRGTRHAWRNRTNHPVVLHAVLLATGGR
jgi:quercetin dioxygenase-like cupin family protein